MGSAKEFQQREGNYKHEVMEILGLKKYIRNEQSFDRHDSRVDTTKKTDMQRPKQILEN